MTYRGSKDQLPKDVTYSEQTAVKGKFSKKSIEAGKSEIVNEIVKQKESLSEINHILRQTMLGQMKKSAFRTDPELSSAFVSLLHLLPSDFEKLDYGSKKMAEYRPQIDKSRKNVFRCICLTARFVPCHVIDIRLIRAITWCCIASNQNNTSFYFFILHFSLSVSIYYPFVASYYS